MKFVFATDFHGDKNAYDDAFGKAVREGCDAVVIGGDDLPKHQTTAFTVFQREFLLHWLFPRFADLRGRGVKTYVALGNDDAMVLNRHLDEAEREGLLVRLDGNGWKPFGDHTILAFNLVPDYPFRGKDFCRGDIERKPNPRQFGPPLSLDEHDWRPLGRPWAEEIAQRPSLAEELTRLPLPPDPEKALFLAHAPPVGLGLDMCRDGEHAGSHAITNHILERGYRLALHGHIHESPAMTGRWHARLGRTTCIQPGAEPPDGVLVDLREKRIVHPTLGEATLACRFQPAYTA